MSAATSVQVGTQMFDYLEPFEHNFQIVDAVGAISRICRFSGHCGAFYSVAQHSVLVAVFAGSRAWDGLAHDLAEAYYGDFPSPLKTLMHESAPLLMSRLKAVDQAVENAFLFNPRLPEVELADRKALATEKRDLLPLSEECEASWGILPKPSDYHLTPLTPVKAEKAWWRQYWSLLDRGLAPRFPQTRPREWCIDT